MVAALKPASCFLFASLGFESPPEQANGIAGVQSLFRGSACFHCYKQEMDQVFRLTWFFFREWVGSSLCVWGANFHFSLGFPGVGLREVSGMCVSRWPDFAACLMVPPGCWEICFCDMSCVVNLQSVPFAPGLYLLNFAVMVGGSYAAFLIMMPAHHLQFDSIWRPFFGLDPWSSNTCDLIVSPNPYLGL